MQDTKRATGRTTRMLLKAVDYSIKHKTKVTIVAHNIDGLFWLRQYASGIVSQVVYDQLEFMTYRAWQERGIGKRDDYFFDHHCFYTEVYNLHNRLEEVKAQLERAEEGYHKYDA